MTRREEQLSEIAREEMRLADLRVEIEATSDRLVALREQLTAEPIERIVAQPEPPLAATQTPTTNAAKVALFRSLFRWREVGEAGGASLCMTLHNGCGRFGVFI